MKPFNLVWEYTVANPQVIKTKSSEFVINGIKTLIIIADSVLNNNTNLQQNCFH